VEKNRGLILLSAIIALVAVIAFVIWYFMAMQLPHPSEANREQLFRWLVLRDVSRQPKDVQVALVDRLEEELSKGINAADGVRSLTDAQRQLVQMNIDFLKHVWFKTRVAQYHKLAPAGRLGFLKEQLQTIANWSTVEITAPGSESGGNNTTQGFFNEIEAWIVEAEGQEKQQMNDAVRDGLICWLATQSLEEQTMEVRLDLALPITEYLDADSDVISSQTSLSTNEQKMLAANAELLLEAWLLHQADLYYEVDESKRDEFVNRQIERVTNWGVLEMLVQNGEQAGTSELSLQAGMLQLVSLVAKWIDRAQPQQQERLRKLFSRVQQQMLLRQFESLLPK